MSASASRSKRRSMPPTRATPSTLRRGRIAESLIISKDGIRLVGHDTTRGPGDRAVTDRQSASSSQTSTCPVVTSRPRSTTSSTACRSPASRSTVRASNDIGVFVFGASNTSMSNDVALGNNGYGFFANTSTGTAFTNDVASGGGEAGFYVGDSPDAKASLKNVESFDNLFGIFIRDAQGVKSGRRQLARQLCRHARARRRAGTRRRCECARQFVQPQPEGVCGRRRGRARRRCRASVSSSSVATM